MITSTQDLKYPIESYINFSPFEDETEIRGRTVKLVKARKEHECHGWYVEFCKPHKIKIGELYWCEKIFNVEAGKWEIYRVSLECIERWFVEQGY